MPPADAPQSQSHGKGSPDVRSLLQEKFSLKGWMFSMEIFHLHFCVHTRRASFFKIEMVYLHRKNSHVFNEEF